MHLIKFVSVLLVAAASAFAAESFEGKITMRITSDGKSHDLAYAIKGSRMRMEMAADGKTMSTILDMKAKEMMMLMPEEKMYMVMPLRDAMDQATSAASTTTFEKTSETETILGYKATKYLVKSKDQKEPIEVWATEGLGSYFNPSDFGPMGGKRKPAAWEAELRSKGFFPLRTVMKGRKGREDKMEVVNVEKTSLPDSFFAPPAGYKKFEMPGMGGLLQGLGGKN
ncbi:MAG: DUF4412 domain-containing protein [Opitutaceae bacterium]|nr:DUF4412 domain-containing protein [Opitutaceae bacterium]